MRTTTLILATTAALAVITGSGCSTNATNTTGAIGTTVAGAEATTAGADDPKQEATDQALALVTRYYQTLSRIDSDVSVPAAALDEVAGGPALTISTADVTVRRSQGVTITGEITVVDTEATEVRIDSAPATVVVRACIDTSSRDAKLPDGSSALSPGSLPRSSQTLKVENVNWPESNGWRVTGNSALEQRRQEPCDA